MSNLIDQRRVASSQTHLVLQAYCLTEVDEINPLGIEIWYRTTRSFRYSVVSRQFGRCLKSIELDTPALFLTSFLVKDSCLMNNEVNHPLPVNHFICCAVIKGIIEAECWFSRYRVRSTFCFGSWTMTTSLLGIVITSRSLTVNSTTQMRINYNIQVHLNKLECRGKVHLFQ